MVSSIVGPDRIDSKLARISLPTPALFALARSYVCWERRSFPLAIRELHWAAQLDDADTAKAASSVNLLIDGGLIKLNGVGEHDRREVEITPLGIAWFEANCDYWRDCNIYRFHMRHATVGCFEYDPRRPLKKRLLDPLVAGAALIGTAFATISMWLIR